VIRYLTTKVKRTKEETKELEDQFTNLDRAIIGKCSTDYGADILSLINVGKAYPVAPFRKKYAGTKRVVESVKKLVRLKVLETR
jgi:hypothetical protein